MTNSNKKDIMDTAETLLSIFYLPAWVKTSSSILSVSKQKSPSLPSIRFNRSFLEIGLDWLGLMSTSQLKPKQ